MDEATARKLFTEAKELAVLISDDWTMSFDQERGRAELCMRDTATGEIVPIAHLLPDLTYDDRRFLAKAPLLFRAVLYVCDRAFSEIRKLRPQVREPKNFAAECAMKCQNDGLFKQYLMQAHQLQDAGDAERVKTRVRSILAITSMKELNDDPAAAGRWRNLRADFDAWRRNR